MEKRRSATAWAGLVQGWKRSGVTAEVFAARAGVRPGTLKWWRWRLGKIAGATAAEVRLVRVEVSRDPDASAIAVEPRGGWQLVTTAGALRVDAPLCGAELSIVLAALMGPRAKAR